MSLLFGDFHKAQRIGSGHLLASCLIPVETLQDSGRLHSFAQFSDDSTISADVRYHLFQSSASFYRPSQDEANLWVDIFVALWTTVKELLAIENSRQQGRWGRAFDAYKELTNLVVRGYSHGFQAWTVPCLYVTGKYLRAFAVKADAEAKAEAENSFGDGFSDDITGTSGKKEKLQEAAWVINRMFITCLGDRSEISQSRKWGIYGTTNLLFRAYFSLNSIRLSKNVLSALEASREDIPPLRLFPKSHVVTFKYYRGVVAFLEENYSEAEEHLTEAWRLCHRDARKNQELILSYLIPCHLLTTHTLPTAGLLALYPRLEALFRPLCTCIKRGDLSGFDAALSSGEQEFVKRRIYLTLERGRDIALRNLFRLVFLAGGFEESKDGQAPIRRTRIPVAEFAAAIRLGCKVDGAATVDFDEVECFLANMIYKNLMKGYIARDRGIVVLSKGGAFPGTGV